MPPIRVFWLTLVAACLVCGSASAWVSTSVKSSATVVDVQPDGRAKVSHEWLIRVRGGPLKSWTVDGVDEDAVVAPDATITRASSGRLAGVPIALEAEKLEGSLHFKLAYKKGRQLGAADIEALRASGVVIARRTIAKYRESLGIPSSVERRRSTDRRQGGDRRLSRPGSDGFSLVPRDVEPSGRSILPPRAGPFPERGGQRPAHTVLVDARDTRRE